MKIDEAINLVERCAVFDCDSCKKRMLSGCADKDKLMDFTETVMATLGEVPRLRKAFALACRVLSDLACPAGAYPEKCGKCEISDRWKCTQRYLLDQVNSEPVCRVCGCTQDNACPGGCSWVEPDLCSGCAGLAR